MQMQKFLIISIAILAMGLGAGSSFADRSGDGGGSRDGAYGGNTGGQANSPRGEAQQRRY
jgi:hypothetical protein